MQSGVELFVVLDHDRMLATVELRRDGVIQISMTSRVKVMPTVSQAVHEATGKKL